MKRKIAFVTAIIAAAVLSGCAVTYTYDGQKYNSKEAFHYAVKTDLDNGLDAVIPLAAPITSKKLILGVPSEPTIRTEFIRRFVTAQGREPIGNAKEIIENMAIFSYTGMQRFTDIARKRNIYSSVQFVELDTINGSIEPSAEADALYYVEPKQGAGQWFYSSQKYGKQVFAFDKSGGTTASKAKGFYEALQAQAVRN